MKRLKRWKRTLAAIALACMVLLLAQAARAHTGSMIGSVSVTGNKVTVKLMDVLRSPLPGVGVTVATGLPEKKPGKGMPLAEGPKGTYTGTIAPPAGEVYVITVDARPPSGDLHRAAVRAGRGEDLPEILTDMAPVDEPGFPWGTYLYIAAVIALGTATAVAMLRKRAQRDGGE